MSLQSEHGSPGKRPPALETLLQEKKLLAAKEMSERKAAWAAAAEAAPHGSPIEIAEIIRRQEQSN